MYIISAHYGCMQLVSNPPVIIIAYKSDYECPPFAYIYVLLSCLYYNLLLNMINI